MCVYVYTFKYYIYRDIICTVQLSNLVQIVYACIMERKYHGYKMKHIWIYMDSILELRYVMQKSQSKSEKEQINFYEFQMYRILARLVSGQ